MIIFCLYFTTLKLYKIGLMFDEAFIIFSITMQSLMILGFSFFKCKSDFVLYFEVLVISLYYYYELLRIMIFFKLIFDYLHYQLYLLFYYIY